MTPIDGKRLPHPYFVCIRDSLIQRGRSDARASAIAARIFQQAPPRDNRLPS